MVSFSIASSAQHAMKWSEAPVLGDLPSSRSNHVAISLRRDLVLLCEGGTRDSKAADMWSVSVDSDGALHYRRLPLSHVAAGSSTFSAGHGQLGRAFHAGARLSDDAFCLFGGSSQDAADMNDLRLVTLSSSVTSEGHWQQLAAAQYSGMHLSASIETYTAEHVGGPWPAARRLHAMAQDPVTGAVVLFGGCFGPMYTPLGDLWLFQTRKPTLPQPEATTAAPAVLSTNSGSTSGSGRQVAAALRRGGLSDCSSHTRLALAWEQVPISGRPPAPRCGHSLTAVPSSAGIGTFVLFAGAVGGVPVSGPPGHGTVVNCADLFVLSLLPDPACMQRAAHARWASIAHLDFELPCGVRVLWPPPRRRHSAVVVSGNFVVFGGYDGSRYFDDTFHAPVARILELAGLPSISAALATSTSATLQTELQSSVSAVGARRLLSCVPPAASAPPADSTVIPCTEEEGGAAWDGGRSVEAPCDYHRSVAPVGGEDAYSNESQILFSSIVASRALDECSIPLPRRVPCRDDASELEDTTQSSHPALRRLSSNAPSTKRTPAVPAMWLDHCIQSVRSLGFDDSVVSDALAELAETSGGLAPYASPDALAEYVCAHADRLLRTARVSSPAALVVKRNDATESAANGVVCASVLPLAPETVSTAPNPFDMFPFEERSPLTSLTDTGAACMAELAQAQAQIQRLQAQLEEARAELLCVVCEERKVSIALQPCGHTACEQCAMQLVAHFPRSLQNLAQREAGATPVPSTDNNRDFLLWNARAPLMLASSVVENSLATGAVGECHMCRRLFTGMLHVYIGSS
jgi:hypothetical protein